jgi:hypothetical protein
MLAFDDIGWPQKGHCNPVGFSSSDPFFRDDVDDPATADDVRSVCFVRAITHNTVSQSNSSQASISSPGEHSS